jgi:hypothetical protein
MFYIMLGSSIVARFYNESQAQAYLAGINADDLAVWDYRIATQPY